MSKFVVINGGSVHPNRKFEFLYEYFCSFRRRQIGALANSIQEQPAEGKDSNRHALHSENADTRIDVWVGHDIKVVPFHKSSHVSFNIPQILNKNN
jgi:hypothetical protein